jgi:hypothetical protein
MAGGSHAARVAAAAVLALATVASASPAAEPARPYDRCAYMNHESKAYKLCVTEEVGAKEKADAKPPVIPKQLPKPSPNS